MGKLLLKPVKSLHSKAMKTFQIHFPPLAIFNWDQPVLREATLTINSILGELLSKASRATGHLAGMNTSGTLLNLAAASASTH
jgi:hypothetical protein